MAEDKERFRQALDFLKVLGISQASATPILRRLVKLYNNEWNLIEEENYGALLDSYFEHVEQMEATSSKRITRNMSRNSSLKDKLYELPRKKFANVALSQDSLAMQAPQYNSCMFEGSGLKITNDQAVNSGSAADEPISGISDSIMDTMVYGTQIECMTYEEQPMTVTNCESRKGDEDKVWTKRQRKELNPACSEVLNARSISMVKEEPIELAVPPQKVVQSERKDMVLIPVKKEPIDTEVLGLITYHKGMESAKQDEDVLLAIAMTYGGISDEDNRETNNCNILSSSGREGLLLECSKLQSQHAGKTNYPHKESSGLAPAQSSQMVAYSPKNLESIDGSQIKKLADKKQIVPVKIEQDLISPLHSGRSYKQSNKLLSLSGPIKPRNVENRLALIPQTTNREENATYTHNGDDISRGQERMPIPVLNEVTEDSLPLSFYYIPRNMTFQNAYLNFSLARIGEEDCCGNCIDDCLKQYPPCFCARETGGEFAYNSDGLLCGHFLQEAIADRRSMESTSRMYYCKVGECPLEQGKKDEVCKGHLMRKFVKECWAKCGCFLQCGNRVVQRGISRKLQVFFTSKKKGWGVRTLEDLQPGTFVCEYVGEVLTNTELDLRNRAREGHTNHYPVLLDADWSSENILRDDELLCLDATNYGNVARFINHRCGDANLLDIPVEIESPDRHYYHIAFFTTRFVKAFEELTWDYCIDFDDVDHPVKAFQCACESRQCRDRKYNEVQKNGD